MDHFDIDSGSIGRKDNPLDMSRFDNNIEVSHTRANASPHSHRGHLCSLAQM